MQKTNYPTAYRQELHERILKASMEEFCKKGIKAVKMDDIASTLAISKRTLYEIYANKETLLLEGIKHKEQQADMHMAEFATKDNHNVIEILIEFLNMHIQSSTAINPAFFDELHKYPDVLNYFRKRHDERLANQNAFFKRGVEEGFFRKDIDYDILTRITDASMDFVMQTQMYREFNLDYILHNVTLLYVRGICTEDGIRLLDKALAQTSDTINKNAC